MFLKWYHVKRDHAQYGDWLEFDVLCSNKNDVSYIYPFKGIPINGNETVWYSVYFISKHWSAYSFDELYKRVCSVLREDNLVPDIFQVYCALMDKSNISICENTQLNSFKETEDDEYVYQHEGDIHNVIVSTEPFVTMYDVMLYHKVEKEDGTNEYQIYQQFIMSGISKEDVKNKMMYKGSDDCIRVEPIGMMFNTNNTD